MVLAGGEFAYGSVSMPMHALPSSSPKTKRRAVAGAMVIALVALCAVICTVFVSRMDSDHSLQQHGAFNPMIGDLASAKAKLASPDAVPLPSVDARSAVETDRVSRLHAKLVQAALSHSAATQVASALPSVEAASAPSAVEPSTSVQSAAAKPASPDDDAIVAALKATLDKQEKDEELKVETQRRKQAGAKILEEFHSPHLAAAPNAASTVETPSAVSAAAPLTEQDTEAALRKELDLKFEADKQKALSGILAEERAGLLSTKSPLNPSGIEAPIAPSPPSPSLASKMLEKTTNEAESAIMPSAAHAHAAAQHASAAQDCVSVKCLTEQLDRKTDADQAKLFAQMREDAIREHLSPPPAHVAVDLHLAASAAQSEAATAQSPAEAAAAHIIKSAADAAKALPAINAAIQQNEREYAELAKTLPPQHQQLAPKQLTPQEKYEQQMREFEDNLQRDEHAALVHQQDDLHAASIAKQHEDAQAAAKSRLVEAITQAKVGKAVQLVAAPHI